MSAVLRFVWLLMVVGHLGGCSGAKDTNGTDGGDAGGDPCSGLICDSPPPDWCKDATTLWVHAKTGSCDAKSGSCEYPVSQRTCAYGCEADHCNPPPAGNLELVIPVGTRLCTRWDWGGDSVRFNWENKARVSLHPGTIVFPKDQAQVEADPIELLEVWPGVVVDPVAASAFFRTVQEQGDLAIHRYELVQSFNVGDRSMQVVLRVDYEFEAGEPRDPIVVLDDPTLFGWTHYAGVFVEEWKEIQLISCHFDYLEERVRTILVENDDRLTFSMRGQEEEFTWPEPAMVYTFELVETRFERGSQTRVVSDFFDLSSSMNHHGCCPGYLAHFDEPVEDIHLVWIDEFSYGMRVHYIDGDGQEIESVPYLDAR